MDKLCHLKKEGNPVTCYNIYEVMSLEDILLSEINQSKKGKKLYDSTYMRYLKQSDYKKRKKTMVVAKDQGKKEKGNCCSVGSELILKIIIEWNGY